jgi:hypothetical protein
MHPSPAGTTSAFTARSSSRPRGPLMAMTSTASVHRSSVPGRPRPRSRTVMLDENAPPATTATPTYASGSARVVAPAAFVVMRSSSASGSNRPSPPRSAPAAARAQPASTVPHTRASSQGRAELDSTWGLGRLHGHKDSKQQAVQNQLLRKSPTLGNSKLYVTTSDIPGAGRGLRTEEALAVGDIAVVCGGSLCHLGDKRKERLSDPTAGDWTYRLPNSSGLGIDGATLADCIENLSPEQHAKQQQLPVAQRRRLKPLATLGSTTFSFFFFFFSLSSLFTVAAYLNIGNAAPLTIHIAWLQMQVRAPGC